LESEQRKPALNPLKWGQSTTTLKPWVSSIATRKDYPLPARNLSIQGRWSSARQHGRIWI